MSLHVSLNQNLLIASLTVFISVLILKPLAKSLKLLDYPGGRKKHQAATPVIGGIALFIGFTVALVCDAHLFQCTQIFWLFSLLIVFIGVIDDRHDVSARKRLLIQTFAAFGLTSFGNASLVNVSDLFFDEPIYSYWAAQVFSALMIVAFINAMNMLDGLDGLFGGIALSQNFLLWLISFKLSGEIHHLISVFLCLLSVFMLFNVPLPKGKHARIFLGDAGSTFIAFFVMWVSIVLSQHEQEASIQSLTILWCLLFPLLDLLSVCLIRLCHGKSCFQAGHEHLHYILIGLGMSRVFVSAAIFSLSLSLGLIGFGLIRLHVREDVQLALMVGVIFVYLITTYYAHQLTSSDSSEDDNTIVV